jgi:hypothetical protein
MTRVNRLRTVFTAEIPETLDDGVLYVSRECRVALHNCACGCGEEVSTPLVATEYRLIMHGDDASLWPSIGNHDFACASHYVIDRGEIVWANKMSRAAIEAGREKDRILKRPPAPEHARTQGTARRETGSLLGWLRSIFRMFFN